MLHDLTDLTPFPASGYAGLADRIAGLLATSNDVVLVQGEAVVALEAAASSLARPGLRALNVVTSPYGDWFGAWLRRGGAEVVDLRGEPGKPVTAAALETGFAAGKFDLAAMVHAESATGILNPLAAFARLARENGALSVVDAVASVGGHVLEIDALGLDVVVIGPQKSLSGHAGCSAVAISPRGWAAMAPPGPAPSILCLSDQKALWIDQGRGMLPGTPSSLEFYALQAALDGVEVEGLAQRQARHAAAARAMRAGVAALGLPLWVPGEAASNLVTAGPVPAGIAVADLCADPACVAAEILPAVGPGGSGLVRLNHTGPRARPEVILATLRAYGVALANRGFGPGPASAVAAAEAVLSTA